MLRLLHEIALCRCLDRVAFSPKTKLKRFGGRLGRTLQRSVRGNAPTESFGVWPRSMLGRIVKTISYCATATRRKFGDECSCNAIVPNASRTGALDLLCHSREFRTGDYEEIMNKASCLSLVSNAFSMNTPERTTAAALRLNLPQWQGGDRPDYRLGAQVLSCDRPRA